MRELLIVFVAYIAGSIKMRPTHFAEVILLLDHLFFSLASLAKNFTTQILPHPSLFGVGVVNALCYVYRQMRVLEERLTLFKSKTCQKRL